MLSVSKLSCLSQAQGCQHGQRPANGSRTVRFRQKSMYRYRSFCFVGKFATLRSERLFRGPPDQAGSTCLGFSLQVVAVHEAAIANLAREPYRYFLCPRVSSTRMNSNVRDRSEALAAAVAWRRCNARRCCCRL